MLAEHDQHTVVAGRRTAFKLSYLKFQVGSKGHVKRLSLIDDQIRRPSTGIFRLDVASDDARIYGAGAVQ